MSRHRASNPVHRGADNCLPTTHLALGRRDIFQYVRLQSIQGCLITGPLKLLCKVMKRKVDTLSHGLPFHHVMPSRGFVALLCAACRTLVDTSASIQRVCLSFRVPPGQLLIVYSTAQPCWASLCREQSIAVLHVVWFCTCPLSSNAADVVCKRKPPQKKKKTSRRSQATAL